MLLFTGAVVSSARLRLTSRSREMNKKLEKLIAQAKAWAEPTAKGARGPGRPQNPDVLRAAQMVVLTGWGESEAARHCGVQYPAVRAAVRRMREEQQKAK